MGSSRQAIGISLVESFWRALDAEIHDFCDLCVFGHVGFLEDPECLRVFLEENHTTWIWTSGTRMLNGEL